MSMRDEWVQKCLYLARCRADLWAGECEKSYVNARLRF